ncbi:MAG: flagellar biosynthesis anti-sigma factor FlgM [Spirochaetes bacterium]|jgi:flagellar biosynthesis anti-sigma factor FlgM|nr:flagellar biosynthesis anti-sigma factor FlgM [Spirochaetota bacterium]
MVLNKIGNINKIFETKKSNSVNKANSAGASSDSIQLSTEGLRAAEEAKTLQMVRETPDVRREKIEAIKQQMQDGTYDRHLDDKVLGLVANKLMNGIFSE